MRLAVSTSIGFAAIPRTLESLSQLNRKCPGSHSLRSTFLPSDDRSAAFVLPYERESGERLHVICKIMGVQIFAAGQGVKSGYADRKSQTTFFAAAGVTFHRAIFVPSFSSSTSITTLSATPDLTWQQTQLQTWTSILQKLGPTLNRKANPVPVAPVPAPAAEHLDQNGSQVTSTRDADVSWDGSGFVMPSLPAALEWLRKAAREQPPGRLQVRTYTMSSKPFMSVFPVL